MVTETSFAAAFSDVSGVERVYLHQDGDHLEVLTVIAQDDDESLYHEIYSRERELIHRFPAIKFDFRVIARRGRPFEEVAGTDSPSWQDPRP